MKMSDKQRTITHTLLAWVCPKSVVIHSQLINQWYDSFEKSIECEGKKGTLIRYKGLHSCAKSIALNKPIENPLPFTKSDKDGIPRLIRPLVPALRGSNEERRLALTLTNVYRLIHVSPVIDTESITAPGIKIPKEFLEEFYNFLKKDLLKRLPPIQLSSEARLLNPGNKSGPNGPALFSAHLDAFALLGNPELLQAIMRLWESFHSPEPNLLLSILGTPPVANCKESKLAFLSEGGGKTRTIAIGDYWSQNVLKVLHKGFMGMLRNMETDGTYDQSLQAERIKLLAGNESESIDLSNATDRFPIELQWCVLSATLNKTFAEDWETIMINRTFHFDNGRTVRYKAGQPMGLLSSWAVFAFTHHALIEFLAFKEGYQSFRDYAVLGDDVVIWNKGVASRYRQFLEDYGIPWSKEKSLVSDSTTIRVEFAKRLFLNHSEITPLNPTLLDKAGTSIYDLFQLIDVMESRGWFTDGTDIKAPEYLSDKGKYLLAILSGLRSPGARTLVNESSRAVLVELDQVKTWVKFYVDQSLRKKLSFLASYRVKDDFKTLLGREGVSISEELNLTFNTANPSHPLPYVLMDIEYRLMEINGRLLDPTLTLEQSLEILLDLKEVPMPMMRTFRRNDEKYRILASTLLKAYFRWVKEGYQPFSFPEITDSDTTS